MKDGNIKMEECKDKELKGRWSVGAVVAARGERVKVGVMTCCLWRTQ